MQHCLHLPSKHFFFVLRLILPNKTLNVLAYGCTSAAATIGEQTIFDQLSKREVNYMYVYDDGSPKFVLRQMPSKQRQ